MSIALAEAGADLLLVDLNETGVRQTAKSIATLARRAEFAVQDVSEPNQVRALFQRLDAEFGRIDFLGNVAGESIIGIIIRMVADITTTCHPSVLIRTTTITGPSTIPSVTRCRGILETA